MNLLNATRSSPPRPPNVASTTGFSKLAGLGIAGLREGDGADMLGGQRAGEPLRQDSVNGFSRRAGFEVALRVVMERDDDIVRVVCALVFLRGLLPQLF